MFGLKKLFGGNKEDSDAAAKGKSKKDGKFFMELDDAVDSATAAVDSAVDTVTSTVSKVTEEIKSGSNQNQKPASTKAPEQDNQSATAATKKQPVAFEEKQQESAQVTATQRKPRKSPAGSASILEEKIPTSVKPVKAENGNGKGETVQMTFAPQYLMPATARPRRRPGPSMEMFKDMARQVKPK